MLASERPQIIATEVINTLVVAVHWLRTIGQQTTLLMYKCKYIRTIFTGISINKCGKYDRVVVAWWGHSGIYPYVGRGWTTNANKYSAKSGAYESSG